MSSLRLLELIVPESDAEAAGDLLAEVEVVDHWSRSLGDGRSSVRAILRAADSEQVLDALSERFLGKAGCRVVLLPVEAVLPRPAEPQAPDPKDAVPDELSAPKQKIGRLSREELYEDVGEDAKLTDVFVATVALSTLVAAIGLARDNVAVVVGGMLIAPLLGPNVALALATTLGDVPLAFRALKTVGIGLLTAFGLSILVSLLYEVDPMVGEIASRTRTGPADVVLALAAGSAGALAITSGVSGSLVGVMVAVALLPPLVTAGLLIGTGEWRLATGALLLVVTNVTCVNLAGVVTFLWKKVRPRTWWEEEQARRATRLAITVWVSLLAILLLAILRPWEA